MLRWALQTAEECWALPHENDPAPLTSSRLVAGAKTRELQYPIHTNLPCTRSPQIVIEHKWAVAPWPCQLEVHCIQTVRPRRRSRGRRKYGIRKHPEADTHRHAKAKNHGAIRTTFQPFYFTRNREYKCRPGGIGVGFWFVANGKTEKYGRSTMCSENLQENSDPDFPRRARLKSLLRKVNGPNLCLLPAGGA